jgi:ATP-dependent exoDNAse (exonuclease V) alpha subunit
VNRRLAYVAVSRGRYDAQIYTNDKTQLVEGLGRDVSHRTATEARREPVAPTKREFPELERELERTRTQIYTIGR